MQKIKVLLLAAILVVVYSLTSRAFAQQPQSVTICHATNSNSNPYVTNSPNIQNNGTLSGGHLNHTGPVWYQGINGDWGDIIPPYSSGNFNYPGLNWSSQGQAFYNNGCNKVTVSPTLTPTPSPKPDCDKEDNYSRRHHHDEDEDDDECLTPTPTPTVTLMPTPTPTAVPTETPNPGGPGDGLGCATHDCSTHPSAPTQAVLGTSTQAVLGLSSTGSSDATQKEVIFFAGSLLMMVSGLVLLRKNA